jgi:hypothetical protein
MIAARHRARARVSRSRSNPVGALATLFGESRWLAVEFWSIENAGAGLVNEPMLLAE